MSKRVRFIHAADLHLGSPLKSVGAESRQIQEMLNNAVYKALDKIVEAALEYCVDLVILSGDIYDQQARSVRANETFVEQMSRLYEHSIPVFIVYGNHDCVENSAELFKLPENVNIFSSEKAECFEIVGVDGELLARVFGQSYKYPFDRRIMHTEYLPENHDVANIGVMHTALDPQINKYIPCSAEDLKNNTFIDYWALGHVHDTRLINNDYPTIAYPGIPQGRNTKECGLKGCFLVELEPQKKADVSFIPVSPIVWLRVDIDIMSETDYVDEIYELFFDKAKDVLEGRYNFSGGFDEICSDMLEVEGYLVRWIVKGRSRAHKSVIENNEEELGASFTEKLRKEFGYGNPFLWTEKVSFKTAPLLPGLEEVSERDEVVKALYDIYEEIKNEPQLCKEAVEKMGRIWSREVDDEKNREDVIYLTDEAFEDILEDSLLLALEEIIENR